MINMENEPNGQLMAQLVHNHLFSLQRPYEEQTQQLELVGQYLLPIILYSFI